MSPTPTSSPNTILLHSLRSLQHLDFQWLLYFFPMYEREGLLPYLKSLKVTFFSKYFACKSETGEKLWEILLIMERVRNPFTLNERPQEDRGASRLIFIGGSDDPRLSNLVSLFNHCMHENSSYDINMSSKPMPSELKPKASSSISTKYIFFLRVSCLIWDHQHHPPMRFMILWITLSRNPQRMNRSVVIFH